MFMQRRKVQPEVLQAILHHALGPHARLKPGTNARLSSTESVLPVAAALHRAKRNASMCRQQYPSSSSSTLWTAASSSSSGTTSTSPADGMATARGSITQNTINKYIPGAGIAFVRYAHIIIQWILKNVYPWVCDKRVPMGM